MPVDVLGVRPFRGQHGRKKETLAAQVLDDRVGDFDRVSTRVEETREEMAMKFAQSHRGFV